MCAWCPQRRFLLAFNKVPLMNFEQAAHSWVAPPQRNDRDEKIYLFIYFRKNLKVQHEFDMNVRDVVHA